MPKGCQVVIISQDLAAYGGGGGGTFGHRVEGRLGLVQVLAQGQVQRPLVGAAQMELVLAPA